jgi:hypothetical protein
MGRESAKSFADRLPAVVPKQEDDVSQLSDEMVDLLYPGRRKRPFRMGVVFDNFGGPNLARALEIARRSPVYRELGAGESLRHQAEFDVTEARALRDLYNIVGEIHTTEVLVEGRSVPYAREIWLPLFWIFVVGESRA